MDGYEATRIVLSRIKTLDPENASKIMGLLLLQDQDEKEMIRLAFGPESLVHSVIVKTKKDLGLMTRPPWSQDEFISPKNNNRGSSLNPASLPFYSNGSRTLTKEFEFMDDVNSRENLLDSVHARSGSSVLDGLGFSDSDLGFGDVPCSYFARGFCKNGSSCRFVHSDGGGAGSPSRIELLRSNSVPSRLAHHFMSRSAAAAGALMIGDDLQKFGKWRPERIDLSAMACPASRQIYLTFPADSIFREEDVSNYFSTFGPVQNVRIPNQEKRMFGFVTFVYPETVKSILTKGNPHFVCDSRVLVKPYREKSKVPDKYRTNQAIERELSPTGLDSSPRGAAGGRGFYNNAQDVLWRSKLEEEVLELQSRRLMNLQLLDTNKHSQLNSPTHIHSPNLFSQTLVSPRPSPVKAGEEIGKRSSKEGSDDDTMNLPERLEDNLPDSPFASSKNHLLVFTESADSSGSDLWSPSSDDDDNSTPFTLSDPFNSFNCQMPRLLPLEMLSGRGGTTCCIGI